MSDDSDAARRGDTGEDATVRDWAAGDEAAPAPDAVTGSVRRPSPLVQGLSAALVAGALAGASALGLLPLAVVVVVVQVTLVVALLALLDAPASGGAVVVGAGTALVADVVVLADDGRTGRLAGVAALGLIAALLHQLSRRGRRHRVTESLADTLLAVVVAVGAAFLLGLHALDRGEQVLLPGLAAAGAVLLVGRVADRLLPRPVLAAGASRGWLGLVLGLATGVGVAVGVAALMGADLPLVSAGLLGLVVAAAVATADLAVDLGAAELRAGRRDARRVAALRPTALLLPYAVLGPVLLLAGRLVLT